MSWSWGWWDGMGYAYKGRFTWGPQVLLMLTSPNIEVKVQLFEPQKTIEIWLIILKVWSWLCYANIRRTCVESWVWCFDWPTFDIALKPHLQKVLPCRHSCHAWDLRLGNPCEVVCPTFHVLNGWDCTDWAQVTWDLVWTGPKSKHWVNQVWSELGPAPPFPPMRVLEVQWSRALSLACEVALCCVGLNVVTLLTLGPLCAA